MEKTESKRLEEVGFTGFLSVRELRELKKMRRFSSTVPSTKGVYVILRLNESKPKFLEKGTGGYFRGEDPNVPIAELKRNWVNGTSIMYIGKTGNLKQRISAYIKFGEMKAVGHRGGRLIWQLADSDDLVVCWKPTAQVPREVEKEMIQCFKYAHGNQRPFANLTD